ncbi:hypothetical protein ACHAWU_002182 [Discostella pseudostelligera]|uniref:J domain-containing protein n=1 Tax=Discostella pseudostelligera TaxID=259834 RepID=A0ABD3M7S0_9STRA
MVTSRRGSRLRPRLRSVIPMACPSKFTSAIFILDLIFLSKMYVSYALALSLDPTSRYLKEMGKLLRENNFHSNAALPLTDSLELEGEANSEWVDYFNGQEENGWSQYQPMDISNAVDDTALASDWRFDTPQPPNDSYDLLEWDVFDKSVHPQGHTEDQYQYSHQLEFHNGMNEPTVDQQINEPSNRPQRFTELFDVVNEQITALGHQIQKSSNSLRSVIDTKFPQSEPEWNYDNQEDYFHFNEGYQQQQPEVQELAFEGFAPQQIEFGPEDENASYEPDSFDDTTEHFETNDQLYDQIPDVSSAYQNEPSEQYYSVGQTTLQNDLDQFTAKNDAGEVVYMRQEKEQERLELELEQLEQEYITRLRAEVARVRQRRQGNEGFRIEAENERLQTQESVSIIKSRAIHQLPDTNDPLELLGLDYHNPPQSVNDIRRAFLRMAKKYHPDAIAVDATPEERERASINFARINSAYQLLKDKQERLGDDYFATMLGGPMYEPRNSHIRQSFSRGYGYDDYSSIFSGNSYSARYGPKHGGQPRPQNGNNRNYSYGATRSPFRRNRQDVGDNCHVSGKDFPPFFNN